MTTIHRLDYNCTPDVVNIFQPCSCDVVMIIIVLTNTIQMFIINDALVGAKNLIYFFFGVLSRTVSLSQKHIDFDADLVLSVQMHLHWVHRNYYIMYTLLLPIGKEECSWYKESPTKFPCFFCRLDVFQRLPIFIINQLIIQ